MSSKPQDAHPRSSWPYWQSEQTPYFTGRVNIYPDDFKHQVEPTKLQIECVSWIIKESNPSTGECPLSVQLVKDSFGYEGMILWRMALVRSRVVLRFQLGVFCWWRMGILVDSFARGYCDHCKFAVTVATPGGKQQLKMHTAKHDKTIGRCSQHRRLLSSLLTDSISLT